MSANGDKPDKTCLQCGKDLEGEPEDAVGYFNGYPFCKACFSAMNFKKYLSAVNLVKKQKQQEEIERRRLELLERKSLEKLKSIEKSIIDSQTNRECTNAQDGDKRPGAGRKDTQTSGYASSSELHPSNLDGNNSQGGADNETDIDTEKINELNSSRENKDGQLNSANALSNGCADSEPEILEDDLETQAEPRVESSTHVLSRGGGAEDTRSKAHQQQSADKPFPCHFCRTNNVSMPENHTTQGRYGEPGHEKCDCPIICRACSDVIRETSWEVLTYGEDAVQYRYHVKCAVCNKCGRNIYLQRVMSDPNADPEKPVCFDCEIPSNLTTIKA